MDGWTEIGLILVSYPLLIDHERSVVFRAHRMFGNWTRDVIPFPLLYECLVELAVAMILIYNRHQVGIFVAGKQTAENRYHIGQIR